MDGLEHRAAGGDAGDHGRGRRLGALLVDPVELEHRVVGDAEQEARVAHRPQPQRLERLGQVGVEPGLEAGHDELPTRPPGRAVVGKDGGEVGGNLIKATLVGENELDLEAS